MKNQKSLHALLIGINAYQGCNPLTGCINDVLAISDYFKNLCEKQEPPIEWKPQYLLAPTNAEEETRILDRGIENYKAPTRQNIIDAFDIFAAADPEKGDFGLFYYSGHGSYLRAPEVFQDCDPSGRVQTLVCVDSRVGGKRDLLDKELGYLIAKALEGKAAIDTGDNKRPGVHFIAITDSCHSGTNTRGDEEDLVARMTSSGNQLQEEKDILGFTRDGNCFYEKFESGQARVKPYGGLKHARYVKLSSAQDAEKAYEKTISIPQAEGAAALEMRHGVFTYSMVSTLNQCGANISYGQLMERIQMEVSSRASGQQVPMLDNTTDKDDELLFLRNEFRTPKQEYAVSFHQQKQEWIMNAGAVQGIVPSSADQKTLVRVSGKSAPVAVQEVRATVSVLDAAAFGPEDRENRTLKATIEQMAFPTIPIGFGPDFLTVDQKVIELGEKILKAKEENQPKYLIWVNEGQPRDLEINLVTNKSGKRSYILTSPGSRVPLFERHDNAETFWVDVEKVARYKNVLKMSNPDTQIDRKQFRVEVQVMEGVPFKGSSLDQVFDEKQLSAENFRRCIDPDIVEIRHKKVGDKYVQPALKVKIGMPEIADASYWVGALYCDSQFGITSKLLRVQRMGKDGTPELNLEFRNDENDTHKWDSIPVFVDPNWHRLGVTEITDYLILFFSNAAEPFNLKQYNQDSIALDITRGLGFSDEEDLEKDDWFTLKIPIRILLPVEQQQISATSAPAFTGFQLKAPGHFSGALQATSLASARRRLDALRDSKSAGLDPNTMFPPSDLWTGLEGAEEVFTRCPITEPQRHLSILEFTGVEGRISAEAPLEIIPDDPLEPAESILPFAYDEINKVYYPIGFTDELGIVRITEMPKPTSGLIGADGVGDTRSVGGSIKLFFRKIVWSKLSGIHDYHSLVLLKKNGDAIEHTEYHGLEKQAAILENIRAAVKDKSKVLLLIHGLVGDTDKMAKAVFQHTELHQGYDAVLAFVYENLGTSNADSAKALRDLLTKCAIAPKSLIVVAPSMGGLVSRWWIEREGGAALVKKLIQLGTPNGGSEIADLREKFANLLTLGINGWPALEPYKAILSFIGRGINRSLFKTIQELQPGSDFLTQLNNSGLPAPTVPYYLVEGNTTKIEAGFDEQDSLWKKLYACLRDRSKYIAADYLFFDNEPNDMVVRTASMREVPWGFEGVVEVESNHFGYFESEKTLDALAGLIPEFNF